MKRAGSVELVVLSCVLLLLLRDVCSTDVKKSAILYGHRGNSYWYPQNTIPSFRSALEVGADVIETDVRYTKDNILVFTHDEDVSTTTNGTGLVSDYTLAELKTLDAGYQFTYDDGRTFPYRGKGIQIPTVEEVFQAFPKAKFNIDLKDSMITAELLPALLKKYNMSSLVTIGSKHEPYLSKFRSLMPNVATVASSEETYVFVAEFLAGKAKMHYPRSDIYELPEVPVVDTAAFIQAANSIGQKVAFWTIDRPEDMIQLLENGADGIMTDDVYLGMEIYRQLGIK